MFSNKTNETGLRLFLFCFASGVCHMKKTFSGNMKLSQIHKNASNDIRNVCMWLVDPKNMGVDTLAFSLSKVLAKI